MRWPQQPASGRPKVEDSALSTSRQEHWFEQLRRHVDLRCLERRGARRGAVWIDGLGDMAAVQEFRHKSAAAMEEVADEYTLASYAVVVTTYQRCAREHARSVCTYDGPPHPHPSPLMRLRWLRLIVDEGHELGGKGLSELASVLGATLASATWVLSATPVGFP